MKATGMRRLSRAVQHVFKADTPHEVTSKDQLVVEDENEGPLIYHREELMKTHSDKTAALKKTRLKINNTCHILQELSDSFAEVRGPCFFLMASEVAQVIQEALESFQTRVENAGAHDDSHAVSPMARLMDSCRRYSVAEHMIAEKERKYQDMPLESLMKEIQVLDDDLAHVEREFLGYQQNIRQLEEALKESKKLCFLFRASYLRQAVEAVTIDCLKDEAN